MGCRRPPDGRQRAPAATAGRASRKAASRLERDALGRITGETQRLYKIAPELHAPAQIEFEHRIAHRLDALGNRQSSQLQGRGPDRMAALRLGPRAWPAAQRQRPHRLRARCACTARRGARCRGRGHKAPGAIQRRWDALGRLQALASQGLQGQAQVPQVLVGQISQRQYHYDALGQLTAVQTAQDTLRYGYDAAGRLRAMQEGGQQQRWDVDPAGNRLPAPDPSRPGGPGQLGRSGACPLAPAGLQPAGPASGQRTRPGATITRWPDNRIGYSEQAAWRYDACGNRVEQLKQMGSASDWAMTGASAHRGRQRGPGHWRADGVGSSTSRYTYDALGRRLKKAVEESDGSHSSQAAATATKTSSSYFGWDGDRLVHTERIDAEARAKADHAHRV
jgi:YD repeat-containing protein